MSDKNAPAGDRRGQHGGHGTFFCLTPHTHYITKNAQCQDVSRLLGQAIAQAEEVWSDD